MQFFNWRNTQSKSYMLSLWLSVSGISNIMRCGILINMSYLDCILLCTANKFSLLRWTICTTLIKRLHKSDTCWQTRNYQTLFRREDNPTTCYQMSKMPVSKIHQQLIGNRILSALLRWIHCHKITFFSTQHAYVGSIRQSSCSVFNFSSSSSRVLSFTVSSRCDAYFSNFFSILSIILVFL